MRPIAFNIGGMLFEGDRTMTGIIAYFTAVVATAILGVIVGSMITDPRLGSLIRTITGILILLVLLRPLLGTDLRELTDTVQQALSREFMTEDYETLYHRKLREQITTTTESYILKEASSIGAKIQVKVTLTADPYPTPYGVEITGKLTPHQQDLMEEYLTLQLGIDPRNQRWNLYDEHP